MCYWHQLFRGNFTISLRCIAAGRKRFVDVPAPGAHHGLSTVRTLTIIGSGQVCQSQVFNPDVRTFVWV